MIITIVIIIVIMIIIMTTTIMMVMVANIPTRRSQTDPRCLQTVFSGSIFRGGAYCCYIDTHTFRDAGGEWGSGWREREGVTRGGGEVGR